MASRMAMILPALAALLLCSHRVVADGLGCISEYTATPKTCDDVSRLAICLANVEATGEDVTNFYPILTREQADKQCPMQRVARQSGGPSIRTENGDIIINSADQDVTFLRYRRQTVSLWGLNDQVQMIESNLSDVFNQVNATLQTELNGITGSLSSSVSSISDEVSQLRDYVDAQCVWPYEYRPNSESPCLPLTECDQGEYESVAPTRASNRVCSDWSTCGSNEFELHSPSRYNNRVCRAITNCSAGQFARIPASTKTDAICQQISTCSSSQFQNALPTPTTDRDCRDISVCSRNQIEGAAPTSSTDRQCVGPFSTCQERLDAGISANLPALVSNGLANLTTNSGTVTTYCYNQGSNGWTLLMKISNYDPSISFLHNAAGWSTGAGGYGLSNINVYNFGQGANTRWNNRDFVSQLYATMPVSNIMVRNSMTSARLSVWTTDGCISARPLRAILSPNSLSCNGRACCNTEYGSGTPVHSGYNTLLLGGDECGDSEPGKIAIRTSCTGDSEMLQLGYTRSGHGNREVWSQGNFWGGLQGMFVLAR